MAKNNFRYGRWNNYTLQCGTIMTLTSPGDCTLQRGTWLWNHDSECTKWQNPAMRYMALGWHAVEFARWKHRAMWHVALGSWHWIHQVAAPCNVAGGCEMTCHGIRPNVRHIGILHLVSNLTIYHITAVDLSFCTSLWNFIQIGPPSAEKKWRHVDFQHGGSQPSWFSGVQ